MSPLDIMRKLLLIALMIVLQWATVLLPSEPDAEQRPSSPATNESQQVTELMKAAANGDIKKVSQLLDSGLNVNVTFARDESEFSGMTALIVASSHGHAELVEELIRRGADVNLKRYVGDTALMFAARSGSVKTVNALLQAGADPNVKVGTPHAGEITPLIDAMNSDSPNRLEVAKILIDAKAEINPTGVFLASPLLNAVDDLEMLKLLVASGADVNQKNFRGATALMVAAGAGTPSVVRYLLEKGADVNARDDEGNTVLMYAEGRRDFDPEPRKEIIQVLKKAQAEAKP